MLTQIGKPSTKYDMVLFGWFADFPDPWDFINILFGKVTSENNQNVSQFSVPAITRKMRAAARLRGQARLAAYAKLDDEIMRNYAPWIPISVPNAREFISARVGCYEAPAFLAALDLAAVCLK